MLDHNFYLEDCRKVGVQPGPDLGDLQEKPSSDRVLSDFIWNLFIVFNFYIYIFLSFFFNIYLAFTRLIGICVPALLLRFGLARR